MTTLQEFITKIGEAGVEASQACEDFARDRLESLCDKDEKGAWIPKTVSVKIGKSVVDLPLLTLMSPQRIDLEELKVKFKTTVHLAKDGNANVTGHFGLLKRGVEVEAEITFKAQDSVEAIELLRETVNRKLSERLGGLDA